MDIIKLSMVTLAVCVLAVQLRSFKQEYAVLLCFAIGIIIFSYVIMKLQIIIHTLEQLGDYWEQYGGYFKILLKMLGITYVCEFTAGICKDAGYLQIGEQIEIAGKVAIMIAGIPVILNLINMIGGL